MALFALFLKYVKTHNEFVVPYTYKLGPITSLMKCPGPKPLLY